MIRRSPRDETRGSHIEAGRGERCQALRTEARALAETLCEPDDTLFDSGAQRLLSLAFPVLETGGRDDVVAVAFALTDLAAALHDDAVGHEVGMLRLGTVVWALVAYALSKHRLDALGELMRARLPGARPTEPERPLLTDLRLRYAEAFDRDAARTFDSYGDWMTSSKELRNRFPSFYERADAWLAEADLVLALRAHAAHDWGNYSRGASLNDFAAVRALRKRLRLPDQRPELARFFGVSGLMLNEMMERLYGGLKIDEADLVRRPASLIERA